MKEGLLKSKLHGISSHGKCFWISGMSGTHVRGALITLVEEFQKRGRPAKSVSVEDEFPRCFARYRYPTDKQQQDSFFERLTQPGGFKLILDEDPPLVQELWRESAHLAARKAKRHLNGGRHDVVLTFHAVFYADKFGSFYSPVDGTVLRQLPAPDKFLTLIDDIGDVAVRLRGQGQVFANRELAGFKSVKEALGDLLTVLEWRSTELTVSQLIGSSVGCTPFVLAVKHPAQTAARVLLDEGIPAYVSHSISELRRRFKETRKWPPFVKELQRFTDCLAGSENTEVKQKWAIPIVPTSIDELRIATSKVGKEELLIPSLLDRWDLPGGTPLVPPSDNTPRSNWLDPSGYFTNKLKGKLTKVTIRELQAIEGLLEAISNRVTKQVNARDHILVSQCPILVAYRPYVAWRVSGGVAAEVNHQTKRSKRGAQRRTVIFLHRIEDRTLRQMGIIVELSAQSFKWVRGADIVPKADVSHLIKRGLEDDYLTSFSSQAIRKRVEEILRQSHIVCDGPSEERKQEVLGQTTTADTEAMVEKLWKQMSVAVDQEDPFKALADQWIEENLTPNQFAVRLEELIPDMKRARRRSSGGRSR